MSVQPIMQSPDPAVDQPPLDWLCRQIERNRFLPVPPPELHNIGDGDFKAIGAEFLGHFVRLGGLGPADRVLDIGCGLGRMALPMTQYLTEPGALYRGVDLTLPGIDWCRRAITGAYENFQFERLDWYHPLYNPGGRQRVVAERRLQFADGSFDFILLTSVVTHLFSDEVTAYGREIRRLLASGGRCFMTAFIMNDDSRERIRTGVTRLAFPLEAPGPEYYAFPEQPTAAVAYDEGHLMHLLNEQGLKLIRPISYGHWCARQSANHYQDILVLGADR